MRVLLLAITLAAISYSPAHAQTTDEYHGLFAPANAYGPGSEVMPENSRLSGMNEFYNRWVDGSLVLDLPQQAQAAMDKFEADNRQITIQASAFLSFRRPTLLYRIMQIRDGADAPAQLQDERGETKKLVLMGRDAVLREVIGAQNMFLDRNNQIAIYQYLQARLAGTPNLPTVPDILVADTNQLRQLNETLLATLEATFGRDASAKAADGFGMCEAEDGSYEVGDADDGDQTGHTCDANPVGLFTAGDWALRTANTCVRNQGERGTSAAFALVAAVESRVARDQHRFSNFSEQHLYSLMTSRWFRVVPDNMDNIAPILSSGITSTIGYAFHFEDIWSYNASYDRQIAMAHGHRSFANSCHWYDGRHCSETNHQGTMICVVVGDNRFCGYIQPMPVATPETIKSLAVIYDVANPDASLVNARRLLRAGVPLTMTFGIPSSFMRNTNGYLGAPNETEGYVGGQSVLVTGWVPNHLRPPGAPEAVGGGYFVIKNSWGRCVGDSGYFYLPSDWVKANAINMTAVF
jgi:hypothetical protein